MNVVVWILQVLLAVFYLFHGMLYVGPPAAMEDWISSMGGAQGQWPPAISPGFRRFIGIAELLAAAGLVLPGLLGILRWLTPLAAAGLMIVMAGAVVYHLSRGEGPSAIFTGLLFGLVTLVAYLRWRVVPISQTLRHRGAPGG